MNHTDLFAFPSAWTTTSPHHLLKFSLNKQQEVKTSAVHTKNANKTPNGSDPFLTLFETLSLHPLVEENRLPLKSGSTISYLHLKMPDKERNESIRLVQLSAHRKPLVVILGKTQQRETKGQAERNWPSELWRWISRSQSRNEFWWRDSGHRSLWWNDVLLPVNYALNCTNGWSE